MKILQSSYVMLPAIVAGWLLAWQASAADRNDSVPGRAAEAPGRAPERTARDRTPESGHTATAARAAAPSRSSSEALKAFMTSRARQMPPKTGHSTAGTAAMQHLDTAHLAVHQPVQASRSAPLTNPGLTVPRRASAAGGPHPTSSVIGGLPSTVTLSKAAKIDGTAMGHKF
jgi:hypothetical protein